LHIPGDKIGGRARVRLVIDLGCIQAWIRFVFNESRHGWHGFGLAGGQLGDLGRGLDLSGRCFRFEVAIFGHWVASWGTTMYNRLETFSVLDKTATG
jgi:hypothetical protein